MHKIMWDVTEVMFVGCSNRFHNIVLQVTYTLWVRFMHTLSSNAELSTTWGKPVPLPFFQNDTEYLKRFQSFSLATQLKTEESIEEYGNDCSLDSPVIKYDQCSANFITLWRESAKSMNEHIRRQGPVVVPGRAALIWPGLLLSHFLQNSIPAWSTHTRNITQVFGKWVFDEGKQCRAASIDTAVCADVDGLLIHVLNALVDALKGPKLSRG